MWPDRMCFVVPSYRIRYTNAVNFLNHSREYRHCFDLEGASSELFSGMQANLYQSTQCRVSKYLNCIECVEPYVHFLHAPLNVVAVRHDVGLCSSSRRRIVKKKKKSSLCFVMSVRPYVTIRERERKQLNRFSWSLVSCGFAAHFSL
jgi:hypothetical protein